MDLGVRVYQHKGCNRDVQKCRASGGNLKVADDTRFYSRYTHNENIQDEEIKILRTLFSTTVKVLNNFTCVNS